MLKKDKKLIANKLELAKNVELLKKINIESIDDNFPGKRHTDGIWIETEASNERKEYSRDTILAHSHTNVLNWCSKVLGKGEVLIIGSDNARSMYNQFLGGDSRYNVHL